MEYTVNPNDPNVSTTADLGTKEWNIERVYTSEFTLDSLIQTLQVIDIFKRKYPNDDMVSSFEDLVRYTICDMFGGTIDFNKQ